MKQKGTKVKILSDFDGVWTDLKDQSQHLFQYAKISLKVITGASEAELEDLFSLIIKEMARNPDLYGWPSEDGRITAFADEDPFLLYNSILPLLSQYFPKVGDSAYFNQLAQEIFNKAMANFKHQFLPQALETLSFLHEHPLVDLVICSNSATDKIAHSLNINGIKDIKIRGGAKKFSLSENQSANQKVWCEYGGRTVFVDRPSYRKILEEENPDLVMGDVFSLDLALPLYLLKDLKKGILCVRPHTPSWSLQLKEERLLFMKNFYLKDEWDKLIRSSV